MRNYRKENCTNEAPLKYLIKLFKNVLLEKTHESLCLKILDKIGFKGVKIPLTIFQKFKNNFFRCIFHQMNCFLLTLLYGISASNI